MMLTTSSRRDRRVLFRALRLPDTVDSEKIESSYCNGVLTITMPKAEEKKKKQIEVKVVNEPETIETTAK